MKHVLQFLLLFFSGFVFLYFMTGGFAPLPKSSKKGIHHTQKINSTPIKVKTPQGDELNLPRMEIENAKTWYYDKEAKSPLATIRLKSAKAISKASLNGDSEVFAVELPEIIVFREGFKDSNLGETRITAERGELNNEYNKGTLSGKVLIYTTDPNGKEVVITTNSISINIQERKISTQDRVHLKTEDISLEGVGLTAGLYINEAIIYKDVVLSLKGFEQKYFKQKKSFLNGKQDLLPEELGEDNSPPVVVTCTGRAVLQRKLRTKPDDKVKKEENRLEENQDIQIAFYDNVQVTREQTQFFCDQLTLNALLEKNTLVTLGPTRPPNFTLEPSLFICCTQTNAPKKSSLFCETFRHLEEEDPKKRIHPISLYGTGHVILKDEKGTATANSIVWNNYPEKQLQILRLAGEPQIDFSFDRKLSFLEMDSQATNAPPQEGILQIRCKDYVEYCRLENGEDQAHFVGKVLITRTVNGQIENRLEAEQMHLQFRREAETTVNIKEITALQNVYIKDIRGEAWSESLRFEKRTEQNSIVTLLGKSKVRFETEDKNWDSSLFNATEEKQENTSPQIDSAPSSNELQIIEAEASKELTFEQIDQNLRKFYLEQEVIVRRYPLKDPKNQVQLSCEKLDCLLREVEKTPKLEQCFAQGNVHLSENRGNVFCQELRYNQESEELTLQEKVRVLAEQGEAHCARFIYNLKSHIGLLEGREELARLIQPTMLEGKKVINFLQGERIAFQQKDSKLEELTALGKVYAQIYPKGELRESFLPKHLANKMSPNSSNNKNSTSPWIVDCEQLKILFETSTTKPKKENELPKKEQDFSAPPQKIIAIGKVHIRSEGEELREIKSEYFSYDAEKNYVKIKSDSAYQTILRQGKDYLMCQVFTYEHKNQQVTCVGGTKTTFTRAINLSSPKDKNSTSGPRLIEISCLDPLIYSGSSNQIVFEKEVHVIVEGDEREAHLPPESRNTELHADKMIVVLNKEQDPVRIEAFGNVLAKQKGLSGKGAKAIWDVERQVGALMENVELRQKNRMARGKKLIWEARTDKAILTGEPAELSENQQSSQYVISPKIIFYPKEDRVEMAHFEIRFLPKGIKFDKKK